MMTEVARPPARQSDLSDAHTERPALQGRKAAISGGTTGIGRAIAVLLASEGAEVFVCGRDPQHLEDGLGRIREVGSGDGMTIDLGEAGAAERFIETAAETLDGLDIVIVNAALPGGGVADMTADELEYMAAVNFTAYLTTAQAAARVLENGSDIVLIGSTSAHKLSAGESVYAATKAGVAGFAEALGKELAPRGIKVSLVEPGTTGSDMQYESFDSQQQVAEIEAERMLRAEDIAVACHFVLTQPRRAMVQQLTMVPRIPRD